MEGYMKKMLGTDDPKILESAKRQIDEGKTIIDIEGESPTVERPATSDVGARGVLASQTVHAHLVPIQL